MRIAVVGYGNIGKSAVEAVRAAQDLELAGVVWRQAGQASPSELAGVAVVKEIDALGKVDAALLCVPSREVAAFAAPLLARGISTVDSFDIHSGILSLRETLNAPAKQGNAAAVIAAGWDPGSDSVVRALMLAAAPRGTTFTDFGPGMSMGHTVAVKAVPGVADALSLTLPAGAGVHRRLVYVKLAEGAALIEVERAIKADPYFAHDETTVRTVDDIDALKDRGHGVRITRNGVSGVTDNQRLTFEMRIHNPALTAQMMTAAARAALRQKPGVYTLIEVPPVDLLPGGREEHIAGLV